MSSMPNDDESQEEVPSLVDIMRANMRGASEYWYWRDKPHMEIGAPEKY
jgi:hypothetical protein